MVVRIEAIRAAGALSLNRAVEPMLEMLDGTEPNKEVRFAAIWSLSEIGGEKANAALESMLDNALTDEEAEFIEDAIDNAGSDSGSLGLGFLDLNDLGNTSSRFTDQDDEDDLEYNDDEDFLDEFDDEADYDEDYSSTGQ
jgi:HEAT repeat protein